MLCRLSAVALCLLVLVGMTGCPKAPTGDATPIANDGKVALGCSEVYTDYEDITANYSIAKSTPRSTLDRVTRNLTQTVDVTLKYTGTAPPPTAPVYLVVVLQQTNVTMPTATGLLCDGRYYYNVASTAATKVPIAFRYASTARLLGYQLQVLHKLPDTVQVPNVVGMTQAAAEAALLSARLAAGAVTEAYSATVPVGQVISQAPLANVTVSKGSQVALVVSSGPNPPVAAFSVNPPAGTAPLKVEFEDLSVAGDGPIDSWTWDFGDGATSQEQHPTHEYSALGIYSVTLTVRSGAAENQIVKAGLVNVAETVQEAFDRFADPSEPASETAEGLVAAMKAVFETRGSAGVHQELDAAFYNFLNSGQDPHLLFQRSEDASLDTLFPSSRTRTDDTAKAAKESGTCLLSDIFDIYEPERLRNSNVVIYINGISTTGFDGQSDFWELSEALQEVQVKRDAGVEFIWNPTAASLFRFFYDLEECGQQVFLDEMAQSGARIKPDDSLVGKIVTVIRSHLAKDERVIVVPHSQGNYYTQQALWLLTEPERNCVSVVETGSPVDDWMDARYDFRVDIASDLVAQISTRYTHPPIPYEGGIAGNWVDWLLSSPVEFVFGNLFAPHSFQGAYMVGQARQAVISRVNELCVLPRPILNAFSVNNKVASTATRTVTLNNECERSPLEYQASESVDFSGALWLPYSPAPQFEIASSGNGYKTVHFKVRNVDGLESEVREDCIDLLESETGSAIASVTPNPVPGLAAAQTILFTGSGFVPGCTVRLHDTTNNRGFSTKTPEFVSSSVLRVTANFGNASATWTGQVISPDKKSQSAEFSFEVTATSEAPILNALFINGGSAETTSRVVTLRHDVRGNPTQYAASESPSFNTSVWLPYSSAPSFTLSAGNGTKTVYFKVMNAAGESSVCQDTIVLNQEAAITWARTWGETGYDYACAIEETSDGGYVMAGSTSALYCPSDMSLVKLDKAGNVQWARALGGGGDEIARAVQQTPDGGYILAGITNSRGAGRFDIYLVKTDLTGNLVWDKTFGGSGYDQAYSLEQTADGGYVIFGSTDSFDTTGSGMFLLKTDSEGTFQWSNAYGGSSSGGTSAMQLTSDGGFILVGSVRVWAGAGFMADMYMVKADSAGNLLWSITYGGRGSSDIADAVRQTADGGYIVAGTWRADGGPSSALVLVKFNSTGGAQWSTGYGLGNAGAVKETMDGGYIVAGSTFYGDSGGRNVYLLKTNGTGSTQWTRVFGGNGTDEGWAVRPTSDGGYIAVGSTNSFGAGSSDAYLVKTDENGNAPIIPAASGK